MYNVTTMGKDTNMGRQDTAAAIMEKDRDTVAADMAAAATTKHLEKIPKNCNKLFEFFVCIGYNSDTACGVSA